MASQDFKQLTFPVLRSSLFFFSEDDQSRLAGLAFWITFFHCKSQLGREKSTSEIFQLNCLSYFYPLHFLKSCPRVESLLTESQPNPFGQWAVAEQTEEVRDGTRSECPLCMEKVSLVLLVLSRLLWAVFLSLQLVEVCPGSEGFVGSDCYWPGGGRMGQKKLLKSHYLVGEKRLYYEKVLLWQKRWMCTGCLTWQQLWVSTPGEAAASRGPFRLLIFESWLQSTRRKF